MGINVPHRRYVCPAADGLQGLIIHPISMAYRGKRVAKAMRCSPVNVDLIFDAPPHTFDRLLSDCVLNDEFLVIIRMRQPGEQCGIQGNDSIPFLCFRRPFYSLVSFEGDRIVNVDPQSVYVHIRPAQAQHFFPSHSRI